MADQTNFNDEFLAREQMIPSQMGQLLGTFITDVSTGEFQNRMHYARFVMQILQQKNVHWSIEAGVLMLKQGLSAEESIPFAEWINRNYFGVSRANFDAEFRVSATRQSKENTSLGVDVKTHTEGKIGGFLGIFGGGGFSVDSGTTYRRDTGVQRGSNYESTVRVHVEMESMPEPELVAFLSQEATEIVKGSVEVSKLIINKQKDRMLTEADQAEVPTGLPKREDTPFGQSENAEGEGNSILGSEN